MKVTLDTSVLIAAQISTGGVCADALRESMFGHEIILSSPILDEFQAKLLSKFAFPAVVAAQLRQRLEVAVTIVEPVPIRRGTCRDQNDEVILGTATAIRCDVLLSVDKDLLVLNPFEGVEIIKPGEFLRRCRIS